jgi:DNA-binding GntR family transcriptional regulator
MSKSSTADRVYKAILDNIQNGVLKPGERLAEESVAQWLGCSRTPVREALSRLLARGLAELGAGRVLVVRRLNRAQIVQLYEMRQILEGAAARLAAKHASKAECDSLLDMLDEQRRLALRPGPKAVEALARSNTAFHRAMVEAAHNPYLQDMTQRMEESLWLLGTTTYSAKGRPQEAHEEHVQLVRAISEGNESQAETIARAHIERALQVRLGMTRTLAE